MKKSHLLIAYAVMLCTSGGALPFNSAQAEETGSMYYYPLTEKDYTDNYHAWRVFLEYHLHREQCQNYVAPPRGYVMKDCNVYRVETARQTETTRVAETVITEITEPAVPYYTIYFGFDESNLRENEQRHLESAAQEMLKYNLTEVTVSAHTDRAGADEYNQKLSERRAQTVARALAAYGIRASVIDQYAYGETNPAVKLGDGVRSQENRRVIIHFKR